MQRREFLWNGFSGLAASAVGKAQTKPLVGGGCDGCNLMFIGMPDRLNWETTLPIAREKGERMEISGTIYRFDGKTVAPGVILYVYHTDAEGLYQPGPHQTDARRHGRLRGWMKTDAQGRYKFHTIRPAAYPKDRIPQHVHPVIKEPAKNDYYLDEFRFTDDPLLTTAERAQEDQRGGSGVIQLVRNRAGAWVGRRDIVLGKNIPNYA